MSTQILFSFPEAWELGCLKCKQSFTDAKGFRRHLRWCYGQRRQRPTVSAEQLNFDWSAGAKPSNLAPAIQDKEEPCESIVQVK